jgi:hypothetical protein
MYLSALPDLYHPVTVWVTEPPELEYDPLILQWLLTRHWLEAKL